VTEVLLPSPSKTKGPRRRFGINPVFARELRERVRRTGTPILLTVYLAFLLLVSFFAYRSARGNRFDGDGIFSNASAGRVMFEWVLFALFVVVSFFVPGYTAAAITSERERQTLVPLQVTLLRPRQIVIGKILASVAYTLLLIVASLPILGLSYAIGGLTVGQMLRGIFGVVFVAIFHGAIAVMWSAVFRRSAAAIVMSYVTVVVLTLGTALLVGALDSINVAEGINTWPLLLNPLIFLADFVIMLGRDEGDFFGFEGIFSTTARGFRGSNTFFAPPWVVSGLALITVSVLAFLLAKRRMRLPAARER
jgi:ABC-2 type transport system permease protein